MNEGALLARLYGNVIADLQQQLVAERARADAAEAALAFERGQREQAQGRLIEMGRQAIQCKEEATHLRLAQTTVETNMRFQLAERIAKDSDQAYQNKARELEDIMRRFNGRPIGRQDEMDLKDLVLTALEDYRMIVRRAL